MSPQLLGMPKCRQLFQRWAQEIWQMTCLLHLRVFYGFHAAWKHQSEAASVALQKLRVSDR